MAKSEPNKFNFAVIGNEGPYEVAWRRLMLLNGTKMEFLRYQGGGPALIALLGGEAHLSLLPCANLLPQMDAGKVKTIAITAKSEVTALANVPTFEEASGTPGYDGGGPNWYGLNAPAGTPKEVVSKIHDDVLDILRTPDIKQRLLNQAISPRLEFSSDDFAQMIKNEMVRWESWSKQVDALAK